MDVFMVSYGLRNRLADANPFGHSFLFLSRLDSTTGKIEVVENWGFGGMPANSPFASIRKLKVNLGVDTDFYGNHGLLSHEKMRRLDRGKGLKAVTFELTKAKFQQLQERCQQMVEDENKAIMEAVEHFKLEPLPPGKFRDYPYEHSSQLIYQYELQRAKAEDRPPRLHEFSLCVFSNSHTCKAQVLSLLYGIITKEQFERISGGHNAIPMFSGAMEKIFLHSCGPLRQHIRSSGAIVNYRENQDTQLYWTLPPQEFEPLTNITRNIFKIDVEYCEEIKSVIQKLQELEWFFRNVELQESLQVIKEKIINEIIKLYERFAIVQQNTPSNVKNDWTNFWRWLSSQPRSLDEEILLDKLNQAKYFIHNLYMAIVDGWQFIDENELKAEESDECNYDLAILAAYLNEAQQRALCHIIGKGFIRPETHLNYRPNANPTLNLER